MNRFFVGALLLSALTPSCHGFAANTPIIRVNIVYDDYGSLRIFASLMTISCTPKAFS